ncbi:hypothetical protein NL466_27745, partial [Klebsiella pneumoniae]|nr:hypothetical protein [Klebsiella pneumoniae]
GPPVQAGHPQAGGPQQQVQPGGPRPYGPLGIDGRPQQHQQQGLAPRGPMQAPAQHPGGRLVPPGPPRPPRLGGAWAVLALNLLAIALTPL